MIARALAVASAVALMSSPAAAETVQNKKHRFQLELPSGFEAASQPAEGSVALYRDSERGMRVSIARIDYPNRGAWRKKKEFFESIEDGVEDAATDYKRISSRRHRLGRVPAFDLWFSRDDDAGFERVGVRFIFYRRYTVVMTVAMTRDAYKRHRSVAKNLVASFKTYFSS